MAGLLAGYLCTHLRAPNCLSTLRATIANLSAQEEDADAERRNEEVAGSTYDWRLWESMIVCVKAYT